MRYALVAIGVLSVLALALAWLRRVERRDVSESWQVDHERRMCGAGVDGVSWRWPVKR